MTKIEDLVFFNCSSLEEIELPNISDIPLQTFYKNINLKTLKIPASVTTMGAHVFSNCKKLDTVYIDSATVANGLTEKTSMGRVMMWAKTIAIKADLGHVASGFLAKEFKVIGSTTLDGVEYITYSQA